jgi:hypothetical protein
LAEEVVASEKPAEAARRMEEVAAVEVVPEKSFDVQSAAGLLVFHG